MIEEGKIIFIDWGIFVHKSIFAWRNNKDIPATWVCMNMIISCLRRIGISPFDDIYVACDYMRSWRKQFADEYKANRKAYRDSFEDIDWDAMYASFDDLLARIDRGTDWHICKIEHLEADDWMAVGSRYFKDKEVILVTYDSDLEQCWHYDNVKIFSPLLKPKRYKVKPKNFNAFQFISKKIEKETADNLTSPVLNKEDYDKRMTCVNLLELPDFVENQILEYFNTLKEKEMVYAEEIPFQSIRDKIGRLYNDTEKIVTYDECVALQEKKKKKKTRRRKKK